MVAFAHNIAVKNVHGAGAIITEFALLSLFAIQENALHESHIMQC